MTNLNVQIPESLYKQIEALAIRENMSIEKLVAIALSAQVSAWLTNGYLEEKAKSDSWQKFQQVLNKVPNVEPEEYDKF
ncbi:MULTISPECIES: ribbon-helix-helix protein, CopG family [Calothrix]|uniref:Ribbon-helix-helix protein, CopG family n=2 Tax=Calothrix TaxID=1186 RepID=A0ABR8ADN0_9CYAN|nr:MULTISPECIES: ribbon-helix-helix protein, CopG family [Calothrix]MBD2196642.1 ribbon-helix-helix protein, CopG family [Calothrix parietina FACHB-288]MBD2224261.1 ribbon-helix-helix protein, CopG family [Calothrix anomala FACHB-343]